MIYFQRFGNTNSRKVLKILPIFPPGPPSRLSPTPTDLPVEELSITTPSRTLSRRPTRRLTLSEALKYFASSLKKPGNYLRIVRAYLKYCLEKGYSIDEVSSSLYTAGKKGNISSPVRRFVRFAGEHSIHQVVKDPLGQKIPPAANALVLLYLSDTKTLRGEESRRSYQVGLNAFFGFIDSRDLSLGGYAAEQFVRHLKEEGKSVFTINRYLSTVKQFSKWLLVNRHRSELQLPPGKVDALRDVDNVKGLARPKGFFKDSLSAPERESLLASIPHARGRAMAVLMSYCGLRTVELVRLRVEDVDLSKGLVHVQGKGKHSRQVIKLFAECKQPLAIYIATLGSPAPQGKLFPGLSTSQVRYWMARYFQLAGLKRKGISAHSLRHTTGQLLLQQGVKPIFVQRQLRHQQFETTQFYLLKEIEQEYLEQMPD
jgi:integrase/recombinase XerD